MVPKLMRDPRGWLSGVLWLLAGAALAVGLGMAPPRFELLLAPGASSTETVVIFSYDAPDQRVDVGVVDWTLDPEGQLRVLPPGTLPYSASAWLQASADPFTLARSGTHPVRFTVAVPKDAALEGSYWTGLSFTTEPRPTEEGEGMTVRVRARAVVVIYVTIPGTERPAAALQGVLLQDGEDGRFVVVDVVNEGNVYLRLGGELRFVNERGEVAARVPLPERVLLRDGLVRYRLALPDDLPDDAVLAAVEIHPRGPADGYGGPPLYGEVPLR